MNTDAIAAALTDAMPILAGTVFPALICASVAAALEWHRLGEEDDDYTVDDYKPATTARATYRYQPPTDGPTEVIRRALPDAGTPSTTSSTPSRPPANGCGRSPPTTRS